MVTEPFNSNDRAPARPHGPPTTRHALALGEHYTNAAVGLVPRVRFELTRLAAPPPQDGVSTSSTTWARAWERASSKPPWLAQEAYFRFGSGFAGAGALLASPAAGFCVAGAAEGAAGPGA
jgi:hypothetical protein